jgi:hypothetical protein
MPDSAVYRHSGIPASMHVHCQIHAAWPKPCCVYMSMLHVHVHSASPCPCSMSMSISMYIYIEMPECRTVRHPVSPVPDCKKLTMPEQVRYRNKLTQSGIFLVRYRTKIRHAGMPMPALVSSMPMPSYANTFCGNTFCDYMLSITKLFSHYRCGDSFRFVWHDVLRLWHFVTLSFCAVKFCNVAFCDNFVCALWSWSINPCKTPASCAWHAVLNSLNYSLK